MSWLGHLSSGPLLQESPAPAGIELGCHTGKCEAWMRQGLEEQVGLQELCFTDSEFSALTW